MKRIVICCDGTWNRLDGDKKTNVAKLAEAILGTAYDHAERPTTQIVYHLDGVGSGRGTGELAQRADKWLGGAFGLGLDALIEEAYRFLVLNYEPGDELYLFGFSRGAYCARSLCGLIRRAGILERQHAGKIDAAMGLYRDRSDDAKSDQERAMRFRADYASHVTTIPGEAGWRRRLNLGSNPMPTRLRVAYLGVWDTVGSLGIPVGAMQGIVADLVNEEFQFHDTDLSPVVAAARHAVAIDERREHFQPALWSLEALKKVEEVNDADYLQQWFPGVHTAVGGGGPDAGLASGSLLWVLEGAEKCGLRVDHGMRDDWKAEVSDGAPADAGWGAASLISKLLFETGARDRSGLEAFTDISEVACRRWHLGYRPGILGRFQKDLDVWQDPRAPREPAT